MIDSELRLRTVRTAVSVLAESERAETRREARRRRSIRNNSILRKGSTLGRSIFTRGKKSGLAPVTEDDPRDRPTRGSPVQPTVDPAGAPAKPGPVGKRRNIYVNVPLPLSERDPKGEPINL